MVERTLEQPVLVERQGAILTVTLNRPHVKNAINLAASELISDAMDQLDVDETLTVGILKGSGSAFCSGMDLKAFLAGERPRTERGFAGLVEKPPTKPLIAAVEGYALAGGFEIVLACDLVVATTDSVFGLPEVRRGLIAGGGGLLRLPRRIPPARASEWVLTGRNVTAAEAERFGLVNVVAEPGEAYAAALNLAGEIARNGPLAVRASKKVMAESAEWPAKEAFERQWAIYEPVRSSADAQEGARAFAERREPVWTGR
jgi:enoyl-CoA hydratase